MNKVQCGHGFWHGQGSLKHIPVAKGSPVKKRAWLRFLLTVPFDYLLPVLCFSWPASLSSLNICLGLWAPVLPPPCGVAALLPWFIYLHRPAAAPPPWESYLHSGVAVSFCAAASKAQGSCGTMGGWGSHDLSLFFCHSVGFREIIEHIKTPLSYGFLRGQTGDVEEW